MSRFGPTDPFFAALDQREHDERVARVLGLKVVTSVSDPPMLTDEDIRRLDEEGRRLREAFDERTKPMEELTAEDHVVLR